MQLPCAVKASVDPLVNEHPAVPADVTEYANAPLALAVADARVTGEFTTVNAVVGAQLTV